MNQQTRSLNIFGNYFKLFLVIAVVIAPFTQLRFAFFGFAELVVLLLFIQVASRPISKSIIYKCMFTQFWCVYLALIFIGSLYNVFILGHVTSTQKGIFFDFAAYLLVLMACFVLEVSIIQRHIDPIEILKKVFYSSSIFLTVMYILSFFTKSLFGFQIMYYHLFVPLADNLHQVSMFTVTLPFVGMYVFSKTVGFWLKLLIILLVILDIQMALSMGSSKAIFAIILGVAFLVLGRFLLIKGKRYFPLFLLVIIWIVVLFILKFDLFTIMVKIFNDADGGGARAFLYSTGFNIAMMSPIFGLGPGQHVPSALDFFSDAHQTHLTIFLQSGFLGLFVFLLIMLRVFIKVIFIPSLLAAFMAVMLYSAGGDILRRLPIWFMIVLIYYAAIKQNFIGRASEIA